jgi:putative transposase
VDFSDLSRFAAETVVTPQGAPQLHSGVVWPVSPQGADLLGSGGLPEQLTKTLPERALVSCPIIWAITSTTRKDTIPATPATAPRLRPSTASAARCAWRFRATATERREPQLIPKHQRRFDGFDEQIVALYTRGITARDTQAHLLEMCRAEVSPELISRVTKAVLEEARAGSRAL